MVFTSYTLYLTQQSLYVLCEVTIHIKDPRWLCFSVLVCEVTWSEGLQVPSASGASGLDGSRKGGVYSTTSLHVPSLVLSSGDLQNGDGRAALQQAIGGQHLCVAFLAHANTSLQGAVFNRHVHVDYLRVRLTTILDLVWTCGNSSISSIWTADVNARLKALKQAADLGAEGLWHQTRRVAGAVVHRGINGGTSSWRSTVIKVESDTLFEDGHWNYHCRNSDAFLRLDNTPKQTCVPCV